MKYKNCKWFHDIVLVFQTARRCSHFSIHNFLPWKKEGFSERGCLFEREGLCNRGFMVQSNLDYPDSSEPR